MNNSKKNGGEVTTYYILGWFVCNDISDILLTKSESSMAKESRNRIYNLGNIIYHVPGLCFWLGSFDRFSMSLDSSMVK